MFSLFFFFENWLYTATYMADARAQILPLVTTGDPDFVEHDFHTIFSRMGVLDYDTKIAAVVRILGWCGMIAVTIWLASRATQAEEQVAGDPLRALIVDQKLKRPTLNPSLNRPGNGQLPLAFGKPAAQAPTSPVASDSSLAKR